MKIRVSIAVACAVFHILFLHEVVAQKSGTWKFESFGGAASAKRFIVVLKDSAVGPSAVDPEVHAYGQYLASRYGGNVRQVFSHAVHGYVSELTDAQATELATDPDVLSVEEDRVMSLAATEASAPWHLDRLDQRAL